MHWRCGWCGQESNEPTPPADGCQQRSNRLHRWEASGRSQSRSCPHGDPTCPCQDGDPCHYEDLPGSPAMTPPEPVTGRTHSPRMTRLHCELRDRLLDAMERRGMTQADLARAVGISQKHLNQMLNGGLNRSGPGDRQHVVEGTLTMWQDLFDATRHRVDVRIARKPKVVI